MQNTTTEYKMTVAAPALPAWVIPTAGGIALAIAVGALLLLVWLNRSKPKTKTSA